MAVQECDTGIHVIATLPSQYKDLVELDVSRSQLDALPKEIVELGSLVSLDASNNNLTELPVDIGRLTSLRYLNVMANR